MKSYSTLFNAISKAVEDLQAAQLRAEEQTISTGLFLFENVEMVEFGIVRADSAEEALQKLKYPEYRVMEIPADVEYLSTTDRHDQWIRRDERG